ncbi:hypothetical protein ABT404_09420 [Streptomyces hyaluromycini]|uniref:Threonyl/alanyl tRNA synthetase SAD domain-containing protein n=1 Tax=Streptomyces hyaluromycini TaxID=1377993 RepID=A0ABV1WS46_9ACTN
MVQYSATQVSEYLTDAYAETVKTKIIASGERDGTGRAAVERSLFPAQGGGHVVAVADPRLTAPEGRESVTGELREAIARAIEAGLPVGAGHDGDGRRLIRLGDIHTAPCGGTHVRSLGELAHVTLPALRVTKGRIKVSYSAEHRAAS